jgi:transcription factor CRZ1
MEMLAHQQQAQYVQNSLQPVQQPMMIGMDASGAGAFRIPAALLQQYPALGNIDWSAVPQGDDTGDLSDVGMGRNSFDASSGGDFGYDESDINEGFVGNNGMNYGGGSQGAW